MSVGCLQMLYFVAIGLLSMKAGLLLQNIVIVDSSSVEMLHAWKLAKDGRSYLRLVAMNTRARNSYRSPYGIYASELYALFLKRTGYGKITSCNDHYNAQIPVAEQEPICTDFVRGQCTGRRWNRIPYQEVFTVAHLYMVTRYWNCRHCATLLSAKDPDYKSIADGLR